MARRPTAPRGANRRTASPLAIRAGYLARTTKVAYRVFRSSPGTAFPVTAGDEHPAECLSEIPSGHVGDPFVVEVPSNFAGVSRSGRVVRWLTYAQSKASRTDYVQPMFCPTLHSF